MIQLSLLRQGHELADPSRQVEVLNRADHVAGFAETLAQTPVPHSDGQQS